MQTTERQQGHSPTEGLQGLSVLVIEDDFYLADDTSRALIEAGAKVIGPYSRFADAADALEASIPDCAVLDINLGRGPDFTTARVLQKQGIRLLFVTGYDHAVIPPELSDVVCLQKPTTGHKIIESVRALCTA